MQGFVAATIASGQLQRVQAIPSGRIAPVDRNSGPGDLRGLV